VNLRHVLSYGAGLVGFTYGFDAGRPEPPAGGSRRGCSSDRRLLAGATANLARGVVRGHRGATGPGTETERWWLDDVLIIAMFGSALTFVVLAVNGVAGARYLVAAVVFASVLAGRIVAQAWHQLRPGRATRTICVLGAAVSLWFAAGLGYTLAQPAPVQSASALASFLEVHHLRNGVGGYWTASITTVESRGAITVRPVWADPDGKLGRYMKLSTATWYSGQHFQFLVYSTPTYQGVDTVSATQTWGLRRTFTSSVTTTCSCGPPPSASHRSRSDSRQACHECRLGVLHSGTSGRRSHLAGCLISNSEIRRCGRALYRTGQRSTDSSGPTISIASA